MKMCPKTAEIIKVCEKQGLTHTVTKKGHHQIRREGKVLAGMAGTASDVRAVRNFRAQLKRAGVTGL